MDYNLFKTINGLSGSWLDGLMRFCANDLAAVMMAIVALAFLWPRGEKVWARRRGAVLSTASAAFALLIAQPISHAVDRMRPYVAHPAHAHLLIARSHDASFPSDHAVGGFALAMGIWLYDKTLGTVMLVLAALLAFSRVYVGTHYPGDVVAGALLGAGVAVVFYVTPVRRLVEWVAGRAGVLEDAVLDRMPRRARAA